VFYVVAGGCVLQRTFDHLQDVARQWGMLENIRFTGFIDDHTLHSYIAQADICLNLRYPSIESSSGSLVEQLYFGKPVVVTRIGAYDELPDEAVIKIDMGDEEGNLSRALEKLVDDQSHRRQVAAAGHAWALAHCSSQDYARQFVEFLSSIQKDGDTLDFVDGVADTLALFLHPGLRDDYARSIAREIQPFIG
jgi:glycosyltransferase involved in cell wall biosynthesis